MYEKWQATKRKNDTTNPAEGPTTKKISKSVKSKNAKGTARFEEDDNIMEMEVGDVLQREEFPSPSEEEISDAEIAEENEEGEIIESSQNNNATCADLNKSNRSISAPRSRSASPRRPTEQIPAFFDEGPGTSTGTRSVQPVDDALAKKVSIMQDFMIKKGLMTSQELNDLLSGDEAGKEVRSARTKQLIEQSKGKKGKTKAPTCASSSSEATIYRHAVKQMVPELHEKIDKLIEEGRQSVSRKVSSSSEELMDISDKTELADINIESVLGEVK